MTVPVVSQILFSGAGILACVCGIAHLRVYLGRRRGMVLPRGVVDMQVEAEALLSEAVRRGLMSTTEYHEVDFSDLESVASALSVVASTPRPE